MIISEHLMDELRAHAAEAHPREACGVLVGPADRMRLDRLIRMRNVSASASEYAFDPEEQMTLWQALEDADEQVWAIYHSHPCTEARPSRVDRESAAYDVPYLIVGSDGEVRAWRIQLGEASEVPVEITSTGAAG